MDWVHSYLVAGSLTTAIAVGYSTTGANNSTILLPFHFSKTHGPKDKIRSPMIMMVYISLVLGDIYKYGWVFLCY